MSEEKISAEKMKFAQDRLGKIFRSGIWNSGLLAFWFASVVPQAFADGSYLWVALGCLCTYFAVHDAMTFYQFYKMNKGVPANGEK